MSDSVEILECLITASEPNALELLRRLRQSPNLTAVLAGMNGDMYDKVRPSDLTAARWTAPPTSSCLEFELSSLHPNAYPKLLPIDTTTVTLDLTTKPGHVQQGSPGSRVGTNMTTQDTPTSLPGSEVVQVHEPSRCIVRGPLAEAVFTDSQSSPQPFYDDRLRELRMDHWTSVPIANDLAACIISSYLVKEHPMIGLFDADLFITNLTGRGPGFCSPFLLSSIMYYACVRHNYFIASRSALLLK